MEQRRKVMGLVIIGTTVGALVAYHMDDLNLLILICAFLICSVVMWCHFDDYEDDDDGGSRIEEETDPPKLRAVE